MPKQEKQTEEVKINFEEKLQNNIKQLEKMIDKCSRELQQYVGALDYAKWTYQEYLKELEEKQKE